MKDEYDFSKAERGKFFRKDARLASPVHPDRLAELEAMPDSAIETNEIAEADEAFFKSAKLGLPPST